MDQGRGSLEILDKPTTGISQFMLPEKLYKDGHSEEEPEEKEARKEIQIQEVYIYIFIPIELHTDY